MGLDGVVCRNSVALGYLPAGIALQTNNSCSADHYIILSMHSKSVIMIIFH